MSSRPLALVTGASRGIGAATARALAPTHDLLLGGRDAVALEKLAVDLPGATPWPVDLTDDGSVTAAVTALDLPRLDVLVHSAGVALLGRVEDTSPETWRRQFEINVVAVAGLTRLLLPALRAARGTVVLVNSGAGHTARPGWASYAASKFALRAFADALRGEEPDLRVASVHPGRVDTEMQRSVVEQEGGRYEADRYLRADSVAAAIVSAATASAEAHVSEIVIRPR
ncbi:SDR family oxidoreductase [Pseudonocardia sp. WMMC193]|uniref:SDR family oxidoreductase n=1 Tax=Pseudonocardia sp. WMMC193 TaxID=2911965 RepID=UPI001F00642C|nr:SDR family oxidoreductase [Pseudonocardia sp. WMMC193]MCF7551961.1 SDR family oxidoreductase [Pseudonocardia sp. WMMC193]